MQADIAEKQNYLYKQIIEAGYNPQVFQQFLLTQNETAQDLSSWHLQDLRKVVQQFKAKQDQQLLKQQQQQKIQQSPEPQPLSPTKSIDNNNIHVQQVEQSQQQIIIFCDKFVENRLLECENPRVEINDFTKKEGGIFEKAFVLYIINTPCLKSIVQRRFSDFQWLRNALIIHHPGLPIPPLPKKGHTRRFDDKHLAKRMMLFQMYLNKLLMMPQLKSDDILQKFLTIQTTSELQKYKSSLKKIKSIPLKKMRTADGTLHLRNDKNIREINSNIMKHYQSIQPDTKKVYKQFKAAATMMEGSANHLKNISTIFKELTAKQKKFCQQSKIQIEQHTYMSIFEFMTDKLASLLRDQAQSFRKQLWCTMKYESLSMLAFIESITNLNSLESQYSHKKINLLRKKHKLYEEGNMQRWQLPEGIAKNLTTKPSKQQAFNIMLPKQTKDIRGSWQKLALYNTQIYKQFLRNYKEKNDYLSWQLKKFTQNNARISNLTMIMWANVDSKISGLNKKHKHIEQIKNQT